SFTLAGVKALNGEVISVKIKVDSLEARIEALEKSPLTPLLQSGEAGFQMALETLGGETIELAPSSIAELVNNMYASVLNGFKSMGLVVEQGIVRAQKLVAGILQTDKLVVNIAPQIDASGQTKDATIGSAQINVGELDTYIMNNQVSTTTKIFVTPEAPVAIGVCEKTAEDTPQRQRGAGGLTIRPQGFRVCMNATSTKIIKFNWWIIETFANSTNFDTNGTNPKDVILNDSEGSQDSSGASRLQNDNGGEGALNSPSASPSASPEPSPAPLTSDIPNIIESASDIGSPSVESPEVVPNPSPSASPEPVEGPSPSVSPVVSPEPAPSVLPSPEPSVEASTPAPIQEPISSEAPTTP
ncbi:hypothetical protein KJ866_03265, partial [Patescibacteria group bacterium]|nr:hypothetical protein [Patescibacteria group bacterium]